MDEKPKNRKKGVYLLLTAFLIAGGGIFLFFIIQGADDLAGPKNKNFQYGSSARNSMMPFFKYLGIVSEDDAALSKYAKERLKSRGVDLEGAKLASADISDWMAKPSAGAASPGPGSGSGYGGSSRGSASASAPSVVPRMGTKAGGLPEGGGSGSKSSGGGSRFGAGGDASSAKITNSLSSASGSDAKGTLGSLRGAQAMLTAATRSGSAMTAKSNWDRSFGVGGGGGRGGGDMAYGKSLVGLDKIKSGEISNLKLPSDKSLTSVAPTLDKEAEAKDAALNAKKDAATDAMKDAAKNMSQSALGGLTSGSGTKDSGSGTGSSPTPPEQIKAAAEKTQEEGGPYCPGKCTTMDGANSFTDNPPKYSKDGDNWTATYTGKETDPDGKVTYYKDVCSIDQSGKVSLIDTYEGDSGKTLTKVRT